MKTKLILLGLSLILLSCHKEDKICGIWERQGDEFAGMKVEISKTGEVVNGIIVFCPYSAEMSGFIINDVKMKGIKHLEDNNYEFEGLVKNSDSHGNINYTYYKLARLILVNDTVIHTIAYAKGSERVGYEQTWIKVKE